MKIRPWKRLDDPTATSPSRVLELWEVMLQDGESTPLLEHAAQEEMVISLEGRGLVQLRDQQVDLTPGNAVVVPAGTPHSILNRSGLPLRGLTVAIHRPSLVTDQGTEKVTAGELERLIDCIPDQIDRPTSLQFIIQLFEAAGQLSEQIDDAIGLDTETGLRTLEAIEEQVMDAVLRIAHSYGGGSNLFPRRF
ncbi:MAG: cupin domain-containing protein [Planctomycetota bacterium]|nr:cupin domain-containing protein [Planctomycetota bacterium]